MLVMGCTSCFIAFQAFCSDQTVKELTFEKVHAALQKARKQPVTLTDNIRTADEVDDILSNYINKHHEGYRIEGKIFYLENDRYILVLDIYDKEEDNHKFIGFDMTDIYQKLSRSKNKETRVKVKEMIADYN